MHLVTARRAPLFLQISTMSLSQVDHLLSLRLADSRFNLLYYSKETMIRKYKSLFEVSPKATLRVWSMLKELDSYFLPVHFHWALFFKKSYATETDNCMIWRCDLKTFRKGTWRTSEVVALIPTVSFWQLMRTFRGYIFSQNCIGITGLFSSYHGWAVCLINQFLKHRYFFIDGTDCRIQEP